MAAYIRTVLVLEGFTEPDAEAVPLFTNGMPALFCHTQKDESGNEELKQLTLFGKSTAADCWNANTDSTIIAYFFKPFTLAAMFNIAAVKLAGAPLDLCNWNAHKANALTMQLYYAGSTQQKTAVLDNLLIQQLQQHSAACEMITYATDHIMYNSGNYSLSATLEKLDMHERTFQRIFKKYVGVTATQYRRICQFQLSFAQVRAGQFDKLTDVAYDNGFADQSHFIRSFREFTQLTPNDYLKHGFPAKDE